MKVKDNKFSFHPSQGTQSLSIHGRFTTPHKAKGTLHFHGNLYRNTHGLLWHNCDSGNAEGRARLRVLGAMSQLKPSAVPSENSRPIH
jgi:hypothetical protein